MYVRCHAVCNIMFIFISTLLDGYMNVLQDDMSGYNQPLPIS